MVKKPIAIDFAAAVDLVRFRGQVMQQAVPLGQGAMAAVLGLDDALVAEACRDAMWQGDLASQGLGMAVSCQLSARFAETQSNSRRSISARIIGFRGTLRYSLAIARTGAREILRFRQRLDGSP